MSTCVNGHDITENLNEAGLCNSCLCLTCKEGDPERSIRCHNCKKWIHYKCSELNPWYILNFVETGSQYKCISCTKTRVIEILTGKNKTEEEIMKKINDIEEDLSNDKTLTAQPPSPSLSPLLPPPLLPSTPPLVTQTQAVALHPSTPYPSSQTRSAIPHLIYPNASIEIPPRDSTQMNVPNMNASQNSFETRSDATSVSTNSTLNSTIEPNRPTGAGEFLEEHEPPTALPLPPSLPPSPPPICKYYKKGRCNYRETCTYSHPKICKFWARNPINGCLYNREECRFYHPYQCFEYENWKRCEIESCRYFHRKNALHDFPLLGERHESRDIYSNQRLPSQPSRAELLPPPQNRPSAPDVNNEREFPSIPGQQRYIRRISSAQNTRQYRQNDNSNHPQPPLESMNTVNHTNPPQDFNPINTQGGNGIGITQIPDHPIVNQSEPPPVIPMQFNPNMQPPYSMQQQQHPPQVPVQIRQNPPLQGHFLPLTMLQEMWKILQPLMQTNAIPVGL